MSHSFDGLPIPCSMVRMATGRSLPWQQVLMLSRSCLWNRLIGLVLVGWAEVLKKDAVFLSQVLGYVIEFTERVAEDSVWIRTLLPHSLPVFS